MQREPAIGDFRITQISHRDRGVTFRVEKYDYAGYTTFHCYWKRVETYHTLLEAESYVERATYKPVETVVAHFDTTGQRL